MISILSWKVYLTNFNLTKKMYLLVVISTWILRNTKTKRGTQELIYIMVGAGLHPVIPEPTKIALSTNSLIDNIFTNYINDKFTVVY